VNERIRELMKQATEEELDYTESGVPFVVREFVPEKFAELIINECADIAKHQVMNISTYADAEFVEEQIKEHFGVEE